MTNREPGLSARVGKIKESATLRLNALVTQMRSEGVDVVNFTTGEPDFAAPEEAKQAVIAALKADRNKYTPVPGIPELRKKIADYTNGQQPSLSRSRPWKPANVVVSNGGKHALFNFFQAAINDGDEVLIPAPFWLSYPDMTLLAGGKPVILDTEASGGFRIQPEQLRKAIGPRTKALVLNSPSNPSGGMYSRQHFQALAEVIRAHPHGKNVWIVSDEIYDRITFGEIEFCSFLEAAPDLRDQTVTVNGHSKSGAMTGWRVGWTVAPEGITAKLAEMQGQSTSGISSLTQAASLAVFDLPESFFRERSEVYKKRRDLVLELLSQCGKMEVFRPLGAFYAFLGIGSYLREGEDSIGFAERLLQEAKVAVVPGTPFGAPDYVRISFATDDKSIKEGCRRLVTYLEGAKR